MLGKIISIIESNVKVGLTINIYNIQNIIGKNVIFESDKKIVGEINNISNNVMDVHLIGEIINNSFIYGDMSKPSFNSICRLIKEEELDIVFGIDKNANSITLGRSYIYDKYDIKLDINSFFANHFAILGNSGSGKSYSVSRIFQNLFYEAKFLPYNVNIFLFDAYGEYQQAFNRISEVNPNLNYKVLTTNLKDNELEKISIPFWLLGLDELALLLDATTANQLPVLEKALKLVGYFTRDESEVINQKNDIIARCLLDIIFGGNSPMEVNNKIISILSKYNSSSLNLEIELTKGGWTRSVRQCLFVDEHGKFADIELVISFLQEFLDDSFELSLPDGTFSYGLKDFAMALEFALISEGIYNSDSVYDYANYLKIRLNTLINSEYANYFDYSSFVTKEDYIKSLLTTSRGGKAQIVNFNINYVDDRFAKSLVKIYSKLLFDYIVNVYPRASQPFHIVLEEAHRYIQKDKDVELLGYNIFERITKEGRKYGILLGLISQRPCEISETVISQCSNFLIFKMFHPLDLQFIKDVIPNTNDGMINQMKSLRSGTCMIFGTAFKMPVLVAMGLPNPSPLSASCDINNTWYIR